MIKKISDVNIGENFYVDNIKHLRIKSFYPFEFSCIALNTENYEVRLFDKKIKVEVKEEM